MSKFSERLRFLRRSSGLTQFELAKCIKISKSSISMFERGEREPNLETLECIADYFNVDMNYLLGKTEIKNKYCDALKSADTGNNFVLTNHERAVVIAYRNNVAMQRAVDKLLDVSQNIDKCENENIFDSLKDLSIISKTAKSIYKK